MVAPFFIQDFIFIPKIVTEKKLAVLHLIAY